MSVVSSIANTESARHSVASSSLYAAGLFSTEPGQRWLQMLHQLGNQGFRGLYQQTKGDVKGAYYQDGIKRANGWPESAIHNDVVSLRRQCPDLDETFSTVLLHHARERFPAGREARALRERIHFPTLPEFSRSFFIYLGQQESLKNGDFFTSRDPLFPRVACMDACRHAMYSTVYAKEPEVTLEEEPSSAQEEDRYSHASRASQATFRSPKPPGSTVSKASSAMPPPPTPPTPEPNQLPQKRVTSPPPKPESVASAARTRPAPEEEAAHPAALEEEEREGRGAEHDRSHAEELQHGAYRDEEEPEAPVPGPMHFPEEEHPELPDVSPEDSISQVQSVPPVRYDRPPPPQEAREDDRHRFTPQRALFERPKPLGNEVRASNIRGSVAVGMPRSLSPRSSRRQDY